METFSNEILKAIEDELLKPDVPSRLKDKGMIFLQALKVPRIKISEFRKICFFGIPDDIRGLRSVCWKVLMNVYSLNTSKWEKDLKNSELNYEEYLKEFLGFSKEYKFQANHKSTDHPLSISQDSHWKKFFADTELWEEIEKDTKRTRSDMHFFLSPTNSPEKKFFAKFANKGKSETHTDVLSRILFIYAKLNPGVAYVQGMNEILAPIYWVFSHDNANTAEFESFFCFNQLMGEIMDCFLRSLDKSKQGINARLDEFGELLLLVDKELATALARNGIVPHYYALRWILLLMTQEFDILNVSRLWDSMLSTTEKSHFIQYVCAAHVMAKKEIILSSEFHIVMEALQNFDGVNVDEIVETAKSLHDLISNKAIF